MSDILPTSVHHHWMINVRMKPPGLYSKNLWKERKKLRLGNTKKLFKSKRHEKQHPIILFSRFMHKICQMKKVGKPVLGFAFRYLNWRRKQRWIVGMMRLWNQSCQKKCHIWKHVNSCGNSERKTWNPRRVELSPFQISRSLRRWRRRCWNELLDMVISRSNFQRFTLPLGQNEMICESLFFGAFPNFGRKNKIIERLFFCSCKFAHAREFDQKSKFLFMILMCVCP